MVRDIQSKLNWNGMGVANLHFNHRKYPTVYWNGEKVLWPDPIGVDEFIWYTFNPQYGYMTNTERNNEVIDQGSTRNYNGLLYGSKSLELYGTGYIDIPTKSGALAYFDYTTKSYIQIETPNNPHRLENIKIGPIVILDSGKFYDTDLDILNNDPMNILKWYFGEDLGFIRKKILGDSLFPVTEATGTILHDIENATINIENDHRWYLSENTGLFPGRCLVNDKNIPYNLVDGNLLHFDGKSYIDTAVSISGNNDFSIMLAFKLPENNADQYLANATSASNNVLYIRHVENDPLNKLTVGLGTQAFTVTFDESLPNHALIVSWNSQNQTIRFAVDGGDLSAEIPFSFTDTTNPMVLGAFDTTGDKGFYGYLGEGIMSIDLIANDDWLAFWERVKDQQLSNIPTVIQCNEFYDCDQDWKCGDPNYLDCSETLLCTDEISCTS